MSEPATIDLYQPGFHEVLPDGSIRVKAQGKDKEGWRWIGYLVFSPAAPEYEFRSWLLTQSNHWQLIDYFRPDELLDFKQEYAELF